MSSITKWIDKKFYSHHGDNWDNVLFRNVILSHIQEDHSILDYGAGRGALKHFDFNSDVKFAAGVDPDEEIFKNPFLHEAKVLPLPSGIIPYEENTFDVVFSANVLEHVADPVIMFKEIRRVLKPGGVFLFKTPNFWHYVPIIAHLTPTSFHVFITKLRGRESHDTFPTLYTCNTTKAVRKFAKETDMEIVDLETVEGRPEYLRIASPLYVVGLVYERLVNMTSLLSVFRVLIFGTLRKPVK